jgi:hypothetical protein
MLELDVSSLDVAEEIRRFLLGATRVPRQPPATKTVTNNPATGRQNDGTVYEI